MNKSQLKDLKELLLILAGDIDEVVESIDEVLHPRRVDPDGEL